LLLMMESLDPLAFRHEALDYTKQSIRLIEVLPDDESIIRCVMRNAKIGDNYTCLSYTWGLDVEDQIIEINGRMFSVRSNLYDFLDVARLKYTGKLFWIDALCIDQGNNVEKNHQVRQMGEMYSRATLVLVWVGKGDPSYWSVHGFHTRQVWTVLRENQ